MNLSAIAAIIQSIALILNALASVPDIPVEIKNQAITLAGEAMQTVTRELQSAPVLPVPVSSPAPSLPAAPTSTPSVLTPTSEAPTLSATSTAIAAATSTPDISLTAQLAGSSQVLPSSATSSRAETYNVISNEPGPKITKIVFDPDPLKVEANEKEKFWVWMNEPDNVAQAWAELDTNNLSTTIPLALAEGTATSGIWYGEWQGLAVAVKDLTVYHTKFYAVDTKAERTQLIMNWTNN